MRYQYKLKQLLTWLSILFVFISILFSYLQFIYSTNVLFSILNNISICILTGAIITMCQACIGYGTAKRESLLLFYKNAIILEKKIYDHSVKGRGFSIAKKGFLEINEITSYFNDEFKFSFELIYKVKSTEKEILASIAIYKVYLGIYKKYYAMEQALGEAINYMELSDEDINIAGLNEAIETKKHNDILANKMNEIIEELGNSEQRKILNENYKVLESYLFSKDRAVK